MFTGIVEAVGRVTGVESNADGRRLTVATNADWEFAEGQSLSVSGACLTVEDATGGGFTAFTATETLDRTTLGGLAPGDGVNLERAMPADGRFDGHLVQGHVDATTRLVERERVGEDWTYRFALPEGLERYVAEKGSIALDGVSLTVAGVDPEAGTFAVALVPTTLRETTLSERDPDDDVNVEVDVLAKYVERMRGAENQGSSGRVPADSSTGSSTDSSSTEAPVVESAADSSAESSDASAPDS